MRPTYLPWLDPGKEVPPPLVYRYDEPNDPNKASFLDWRGPSDQKTAPYYVLLYRESDPNLSAPGRPEAMSIEGSDPGELYEGIDPGEASIYWVIPNVSSCATVVLTLLAPDMDRRRALREIVRIAESLQPAG